MMHKKTNRLDDVIANPLKAIFYALQEFDVPWKSLNVNINLDSDYCICHSGKKITSPLVDFFIDSETGKIDSTSMAMLANVIYTKYGVKWNRQWETMFFEYNPISNYDMIEVMEDDETVHEYGHRLNTTRTGNNSNTVEGEFSNDSDTENKKAGFNSSDYQKDTQNVTQNSGTQSTTETGTNSESGSNTESGSDTDTRNYTLTRSGNIGVTTSQQMIESERQLWMWNFFDSVVYPDIDRVLTINMY